MGAAIRCVALGGIRLGNTPAPVSSLHWANASLAIERLTKPSIASECSGLLCHGTVMVVNRLIEQSRGVIDPARRAVLTTLTGTDQFILIPQYLAVTPTFLGYLDQTRNLMKEALSEARRLEHAHTLAQVLQQSSRVAWFTGSPD